MKNLTALAAALLLTTASLTACGASESKMSIQEQTEQRFQLNPNPKEAYRIKIKINDAPGPLKLIHDMYIGYKAENCSYLITSEFIGAKAHPKKDLQNPIKQIGEYEYETFFYADAMKDEDYFGEGVCHWQPENFGTSFKATGKSQETEFNISDLMKYLLEKKTLTKYYWKGGYPYFLNDDGSIYNDDNVVVFGNSPDKLTNYTEEQRENLFSITLTLEKL